MISPDGQTRGVSLSETGKGTLSICEPELWWPNGLGEQPLYQVRVQLFLDGKQCDLWERKIGLRSMTVKREKDEWGESFAHEVNGICFFAMGADYIPEGASSGKKKQRADQKITDGL